MRELSKKFITPPIKEALESLSVTFPMYELSLDIGISETSLRSFLKGKGLKDELYTKIIKFLISRDYLLQDESLEM